MEKRVQGHTGIFFQLLAYLLANLKGESCGVGEIEILDKDECELFRSDECFVKVPEEDVFQSIGGSWFWGPVSSLVWVNIWIGGQW